MSDPSPRARAPEIPAFDETWALFLDFDGTLVDIAPTPEAVRVEAGVRESLDALRRRLGGAMAVVSGRPVATIDGFLMPLRVDVAGLHGIELRLGGDFFPCRPEEHPALRRMAETLRVALEGEPGVILEDKGCSFAVHWRLADVEPAARAQRLVADAAEGLGSAYRLQRGKAVAEILPARASKGAVMEDILERPPYRGRRPVFIGDDLTDEHGFAAVNAQGGLSIKVGEGPTQALHRLSSPATVRATLARWAAAHPLTSG